MAGLWVCTTALSNHVASANSDASSNDATTPQSGAASLEDIRVNLAVSLAAHDDSAIRKCTAELTAFSTSNSTIRIQILHERLEAYFALKDWRQFGATFTALFGRKSQDAAEQKLMMKYLDDDLRKVMSPTAQLKVNDAILACLQKLDPAPSPLRFRLFIFYAMCPRPYAQKVALIQSEISRESQGLKLRPSSTALTYLKKMKLFLADAQFRNLDSKGLRNTAKAYLDLYGPNGHDSEQMLMRMLLTLDIMHRDNKKDLVAKTIASEPWLKVWVHQTTLGPRNSGRDEIALLWSEVSR